MSTNSIVSTLGADHWNGLARRMRRAHRYGVRWLARHSIDVLRISVGLVFLAFGVLKFFPGVSPAQELAVHTLQTLSFGVLPASVALAMTATAEVFIGLTLVTGRLLKTGLVVLAGSLVGIMSPLVLFFSQMFPGAPTLEAQYVAKDIVLVAAGLVIAARALGARLVAEDASEGAAEAR